MWVAERGCEHSYLQRECEVEKLVSVLIVWNDAADAGQ